MLLLAGPNRCEPDSELTARSFLTPTLASIPATTIWINGTSAAARVNYSGSPPDITSSHDNEHNKVEYLESYHARTMRRVAGGGSWAPLLNNGISIPVVRSLWSMNIRCTLRSWKRLHAFMIPLGKMNSIKMDRLLVM